MAVKVKECGACGRAHTAGTGCAFCALVESDRLGRCRDCGRRLLLADLTLAGGELFCGPCHTDALERLRVLIVTGVMA